MNAVPRPAEPAIQAEAARPLISRTLAQFAHDLTFDAVPPRCASAPST